MSQMDHHLRCNSLKCREQLDKKAVVTTCSHIFCVPCAESLGLATASANTRTCPACQTQLPSDDDVVITDLNPSEDYKTSVLSGLNPAIITECAGRGMAFYHYQTTQEIVYQEYLARSLTDKYSTLSSQMDKVIGDANSEISSLRGKLEALQLQRNELEKKNQELVGHFRAKSKKHQQLQQAYQDLKRKQLSAGIEDAADLEAEDVLQAAAAGVNPHLNRHAQPVPSRGSHRSGGSGPRRLTINTWPNQAPGNRVYTAQSAPIPATPSVHRTRMSNFQGGRTSNAVGGDVYHQPTPQRSAFKNIDPKIYGNMNESYGMSAGAKFPRQHNDPINRTGVGMARPGSHGGFIVL